MAEKDYYKILEVGRDASQEEIKKAFRHLARKYHPDIAGKESEDKFKEINEAFQVLSDPEKRSQYDQYGQSAFRHGEFSGSRAQNFDDLFRDFGFGDIFDVFSGMGSGRSRQREPEEGADLKYEMEISLEDSFKGMAMKIEVPGHSECKSCKGTGAKPGFIKTCQQCGGSGHVRKVQKTAFIQFMTSGPCDRCGGMGKIIEKKCEDCDGRGRIKATKKIEIKIPRGIDDDSYLRISGQGEPGRRGGESGDLYVVIHVKPHDIFERRDNDLFCKTEISLSHAIFGGELQVPTISGKAVIRIPAGTQSHTVFRLRGQGMPDVHTGKRGDQLVKVVVKVPEKLSQKQKEMIRDFAKESGEEIKTTKGFFERMREHF
jgi:molecular chaperone DnaJ